MLWYVLAKSTVREIDASLITKAFAPGPFDMTMKNSPYNAAQAEAKWRAQWRAWEVSRWDPRRSRQETFVIDTPPPTVSGELHIGHVFSYTH